MRSINKVFLIGNLTRDPAMRITSTGQHVTLFGIATNREWITKDGRREESSEFHDIVCWGGLAELTNQYLKKGKLVYIEGYLKTRSWDDDKGVKRFRTEIIVDDLIILEKRNKNATNAVTTDFPPEMESKDTNDRSLQPSVTVENPFTI